MIRHPSRRYIDYLISKKSRTALEIVATLHDLGLPTPPVTLQLPEALVPNPVYADFVNQIRQIQQNRIYPPGYSPHDPTHQPTNDFLSELRIRSMWRGDPFVGPAADILLEPVMKRQLEVMLLGPLKFEAIAKRMMRRFQLPLEAMNVRVVQVYAHYYWDYSALDREDWDLLLKNWVHGSNTDYLVSLHAPRTTYGAALSTWMSDGMNTPLKETHAIRAMRDESFRHFMQASTIYRPGSHTAQAMRDYFNIYLQGQEAIEMRQGGTAEVLEELRRIEADYDNTPMMTIGELPSASISSIDTTSEYEAQQQDEKKHE